MRIALIADIHANLVALEAVLADLGRLQIDQTICLGDVAATGPQPHEVLTRLRELDVPGVMGNADAELLSPSHVPASDEERRILEISRWCAAQLTDADREYLRRFRPTIDWPLGADRRLLCFHGSPHSYDDIIVATTPDDDLAGLLSGFDATVMAGGHTHAQLVRRFRGAIVVNPGSVGLPYERGSEPQSVRNPPWAEYALVHDADGALGVELRRVPVDIAQVLRAIRESGVPHAEMLAADWR